MGDSDSAPCMNRKSRPTACIAATGLAALLGAPLAAPADTQSESAEAATRVEEVVVSAQRRKENRQRVPISAQVVGQQALTQQNLNSVTALAETSPSIHVKGSGRSSNFYVRGTGSGESQSFDQSVGTFIDDIYHGRSRLSEGTFLDLDHIEILKGPQSTFFGNNAIAGAFNIVTRRPGKELEGHVRALGSPRTGDNGGQYAGEGALTLPLNDSASVRMAAIANGQRGYLRNTFNGQHVPKQDNGAFRTTLAYAPSPGLDIELKGEVGRSINKGGLVLRQTSCPPPAPFVAAGFCAINVASGPVPSLSSDEYTANDGNQTRLHTYESVLTANYQLDAATLTSVTGYNGYRFKLDLDDDATTRDLLNVQAPEKYHQLSQEFRIASATDRRIEYLAGVYFQADQLDIEQSISYFFLTPNLSAAPPLAPIVPFLPLGQQVNALQDERVYSAFGSLTWNISDDLKLIGGLRASKVTKDFDWALAFGTATARYGGIVPFPASVVPIANRLGLGTTGQVSLDRDDEALMPSAKVQYQVTTDAMAYLSYSRGFKAGGFSVAELSAIEANYPFDPEFVDAYEAGFKSEWLDRRMLFNLALFRNDFSDLQVVIQGTSATGALINFIRNAAASRSQGVEIESQWIVSPMFRVGVAGTYLDSKYERYPNAGPTYAQQLAGRTSQDLSGHRTLYAPKWSGNVTATLTVPVSSSYELTAEAIGILSTRYQTYSTDDPLTAQPGYGRLDARLSLDSADGRWGVDVIGKNLTNTLIRTFSGYQPTSRGSLFQDREQFRSVALQLRYHF